MKITDLMCQNYEDRELVWLPGMLKIIALLRELDLLKFRFLNLEYSQGKE